MSFEQDLLAVRPNAWKYALFLTRNSTDADDLLQEASAKLLASNYDKITEGLITTTVKNIWRDRLAYNAVRKNTVQMTEYNTLFAFVLPQVEEEIYCREVGLDLNNWPDYDAKCSQCNTPFTKPEKKSWQGRPKEYCSDQCYKAARRAKDTLRKRLSRENKNI